MLGYSLTSLPLLRSGMTFAAVGFWAALAAALLMAGAAAYPANRWLLARGKDHAVVHAHR